MPFERAKIFYPFKALEGLDEALAAKEQEVLARQTPNLVLVPQASVNLIYQKKDQLHQIQGVITAIDEEQITINKTVINRAAIRHIKRM